MFSHTIRMMHKHNEVRYAKEQHHSGTPRTKTVYVNKYDHLSTQLDDLTELTVKLKDTHESKIKSLEEENVDLKRRVSELTVMNNELLDTYELEDSITEKLNIYLTDVDGNDYPVV